MRAYVALGSNVGDSRQYVLSGIAALGVLPRTEVLARSRLYRTAPWGVVSQPDFVNAAVMLETALEPHDLLRALLDIERGAGRDRSGERWGPRTLDLDLLHVAGRRHGDETLVLPHPYIAQRAFVLLPLNDVAPELDIPGQGRVADLLQVIDKQGCQVMA